MSAERWNRSALKPHLVSNGKNIKDYYPQRQKGHEHLRHGVQAKFRGPFLRETEHVFGKKKSFLLCTVESEHCDLLTFWYLSQKNIYFPARSQSEVLILLVVAR